MTRISARIVPIFSTPPVSPPSRCSSGTSTSSRRISPVTEARTDILSIGLPSVMPRMVARSSRNRAMFFRPALVRRLGGDRQQVGHRRVGHPGLGPAQHPAVAAPLGPRRDVGDVGAGVGLGQRERRDQVAAQRRHQVALAQRLGAVLVDEVRPHQRLHGGRRRQRQRAPRQLLGEQAVRHHVGVGAAVLLGVAQPEVARARRAA